MGKKNQAIRTVLILLMAALFIVLSPGHVLAKAKIKISPKKVTVTVGKSKTVKVIGKKKVSWKVLSGKKCIQIRKYPASIRIKGIKAGTAKIQAKAGKKKLRAFVTIKDPKKEQEEGNEENQEEEDVNGRAAGVGDFTFILLRTIRNQGERNTLISPDSILSALAMTAAGADGNTLREMNAAMQTESCEDLSEYLLAVHSRLGSSKTIKYKVADSIWTNQDQITVKEEFINANKKYFEASLFSLPFNAAAVLKMNAWVSEHTDKMIPSIINNLSPEARMVLLNAICFEGKWRQPYEDSQIRQDTFTLQDGSKKKADMMNETDRGKYYLELAGGRGFVKYYEDPQTAFFAFLPPEGEGVDTYLSKITGQAFRQAYQNRMDRIVKTKIPVFSLDYEKSLAGPLKAMGMQSAFSPDADFSRMSDTPLAIDDVIHKTHIEVDKNGTKAAAATAVVMKENSVYDPSTPKKEEIFLNRPFVYGIMDTRTAIPLFIGVLDSTGQ